MIASAKWELVTDRWQGPLPLAEQLLRWQAGGVSAEAMARLITMETDVRMSGETVRRWVRALSKATAA